MCGVHNLHRVELILALKLLLINTQFKRGVIKNVHRLELCASIPHHVYAWCKIYTAFSASHAKMPHRENTQCTIYTKLSVALHFHTIFMLGVKFTPRSALLVLKFDTTKIPGVKCTPRWAPRAWIPHRKNNRCKFYTALSVPCSNSTPDLCPV